MKMIDMLRNVDKTSKNWINYSELYAAFNMTRNYNEPERDVDRLAEYDLFVWLCTDSWVGYKVIYLDNEPACVTFQPARKSDVTFSFVSKEMKNKVREYLMSLSIPENDGIHIMTSYELNEECKPFGKLEYTGQFLSHYHCGARYEGRLVMVRKPENHGYIAHDMIVQLNDGTTKTVDLEELEFPYRLEKNRH